MYITPKSISDHDAENSNPGQTYEKKGEEEEKGQLQHVRAYAKNYKGNTAGDSDIDETIERLILDDVKQHELEEQKERDALPTQANVNANQTTQLVDRSLSIKSRSGTPEREERGDGDGSALDPALAFGEQEFELNNSNRAFIASGLDSQYSGNVKEVLGIDNQIGSRTDKKNITAKSNELIGLQ